MKDCFSLRFNCQKSGLDITDNPVVFSNLFEVSAENIEFILSKYRELNHHSFLEISSKIDIDILRKKFETKKFLVMGDSITSDRCSYEKIFELALPGQVVDKSISGSYSINVAANINKYLAEINPDYVIVSIGTNDTLFSDKNRSNTSASSNEYRRNLRIIADRVHSQGATLIINSIPSIFANKFNQNNMYWTVNNKTNEQFNDIAELVAKETKSCFHDYRSIFENENNDFMFEEDGIHLSPYAHKKIAQSLFEFLIKTNI